MELKKVDNSVNVVLIGGLDFVIELHNDECSKNEI